MVALPLLLLLLGSSPMARAAAADDEHADELTVPDMSSQKPHAACSGHRVMPPADSGSWVPLYRPLGPCSPSFRGAARPPSVVDLLRQDRLRVRHIHRKASGDVARESKGFRKQPVTVEETQIHHQPAISVGMGSESRGSAAEAMSIGPAATDDGSSSSPPQTVVLDTATDVPWVRCVPCQFAQCAGYDPSRSSTYAAFPCNSSACKQLGPYANGCVNDQCQYSIRSGGNGPVISSGTYSSDQLTINSANAVPGFRFGCSRSEQGEGGGSFDDAQQATDGVMALGPGVQSLTAQTSATYGNAFSYCLPPSDTSKGFFKLGVPSDWASRFVTTPMLRGRRENPTLYRALLVAITVDGRPLNVGAEVFAAGTVMDSRTVITRLPLTAYGALRAAFRDRMAPYRAAPPQEDLDTCYDLAGARYPPKLPRVALVFDRNAVVELDRSGLLLNGCLAFASNDDDTAPSILGNVQQQTIEVLHDIGGRSIGFRRQAC